MKAHQWIDRLKVAKGLPSDYAVAKLLKMRPSSISNYRARNSTLDDDAALKVAMLLEVDPVLVLADQATERSKDESVQSVWRTMLAQLLSKEKAPHMAGLGLGGNGRNRKNDQKPQKNPGNDSGSETFAVLARSLFPSGLRQA